MTENEEIAALKQQVEQLEANQLSTIRTLKSLLNIQKQHKKEIVANELLSNVCFLLPTIDVDKHDDKNLALSKYVGTLLFLSLSVRLGNISPKEAKKRENEAAREAQEELKEAEKSLEKIGFPKNIPYHQ